MVLVIDDQEEMLRSLSIYLNNFDYRVVTASNGEEGIDVALEFKPDVVVTDLNMPVMDGWTFLRVLRSTPKLALTPVIVLSSLGDMNVRRKGFSYGADDFVNKDHFFGELTFRISKTLTMSRIQRRCALLEMQKMDTSELAFVGRLEDFPLFSLITLCRIQKKSGTLELTGEGGKSVIHIKDGKVESARLIGDVLLENQDAIDLMLTWKEGTFYMKRLDENGDPESDSRWSSDLVALTSESPLSSAMESAN
ncbi:MAG: response regulator [Verrucomicrobiota bacterium]